MNRRKTNEETTKSNTYHINRSIRITWSKRDSSSYKLKETSSNEANKLKQAEIDMSDVDQKSKDVLNKLR